MDGFEIKLNIITNSFDRELRKALWSNSFIAKFIFSEGNVVDMLDKVTKLPDKDPLRVQAIQELRNILSSFTDNVKTPTAVVKEIINDLNQVDGMIFLKRDDIKVKLTYDEMSIRDYFNAKEPLMDDRVEGAESK